MKSRRVYRLYQDDKVAPEAFNRFFLPLAEREKQFEADLPRLRTGRAQNQPAFKRRSDIVEATDLYGRWPKLSFEEKRRFVESITDRIVIGKEDVDISLCYLPVSEDMTKRHRMLYGAAPERGGA